jgi:hypothetical protein
MILDLPTVLWLVLFPVAFGALYVSLLKETL